MGSSVLGQMSMTHEDIIAVIDMGGDSVQVGYGHTVLVTWTAGIAVVVTCMGGRFPYSTLVVKCMWSLHYPTSLTVSVEQATNSATGILAVQTLRHHSAKLFPGIPLGTTGETVAINGVFGGRRT